MADEKENEIELTREEYEEYRKFRDRHRLSIEVFERLLKEKKDD